MKWNVSLLSAVVAGISTSIAQGAVLYSTGGYTPAGTYSQNFDSLPNTPTNVTVQVTRPWNDDTTQTANNTSIPGWYLWHPVLQTEGGANGHQRIRFGRGNVNTGTFYSFGSDGSTDRALGMTSSNTMAAGGATDNGESYYGVRITNNTGYLLTDFRLKFIGEQWRDGGAATPVAQSIAFGYKVTSGAALLQDTGFTSVGAGTFTTPVFANTGGGAAVDGNGPGKGAVQSVNVSGLNWLPGQDLWLRWTDLNDGGNDHGLSIDDLTFQAVPEPGTFVLAGIASLGMLATRRRR